METDISNFLGLFIIIPIGLIQFGYLYYLLHKNDQEIKTIKTCIINGDKLKSQMNAEIKQLSSRNQPAKQNQSFSETEKVDLQQKLNKLGQENTKQIDTLQKVLGESKQQFEQSLQQQNNECEQIKQKFEIFEQQKNEQLQKLDQSLNNTLNKFAELELKFEQCEATKNAVSEVKSQIPVIEQSILSQSQLIQQQFANLETTIFNKLQQDISALQTSVQNAINQQRQEHQGQIDQLQNNIQHRLNSLGVSQLEHTIQELSSQMEQTNLQLSQVELVKQQIENQQRLLQQKCEQKDVLNIQNQISNAVNQLQDQINELKNINPNQPNPPNPPNLPNPPNPPSIIQDEGTIVTQLYNLTTNQRHVEAQYKAFVNDELDVNELIKEYGMGQMNNKKTLRQSLRGMRKVRGDGNCFYTAFVFQYLKQIIVEENDEIFNSFIESTKELKFKITYQQLQLTEQQLEQVKNQFIERCQAIRAIDESDRMAIFSQYFKDDNDEYYGQAIIFLRSLAFKICDTEEIRQLFQAQKLDLKFQLLEWEQDCESNEIIIQNLSKALNLKTTFFYCNNKDKNIEKLEFDGTQNSKLSIYLLFRPGHYCIGLPQKN